MTNVNRVELDSCLDSSLEKTTQIEHTLSFDVDLIDARDTTADTEDSAPVKKN